MILFASLTLAQAPEAIPAAPASPRFETDGELRLIGSNPPTLVVDTEDHVLGQDMVLDSRLRAGLQVHLQSWNIRAEGDFFDGQLAGDGWDIRGTEDARHREEIGVINLNSFDARRLSLDGRLGPVLVDAGLMTSHWGLGMVANDGAHDPYFGRNDFGDRVLRLRLTTRLSENVPLFFSVAGDRVVEDDTADWGPVVGGEAAYQGIALLLYSDKVGNQAGLYGVYRHQRESDQERLTQVGVVDVFGSMNRVAGRHTIRLAIEAAGIFGETNRAQSYNARDGLGVSSLGVTGLASVSYDPLRANVIFRGGYASGDGNPDDSGSHDFAFDRDFDVGMVLFDEVQGAIDAAAYAQLTDPAHSGGAPDGAEALVGEGAFRHAAFFQPILAWKLRPFLGLSAGVLMAWNTAPVSQPFATYRNGGIPANQLGQVTAGYGLGTEVDWSVKVGDVPVKIKSVALEPALILQGGHLFASDNLGGGVHTLITATGQVRW